MSVGSRSAIFLIMYDRYLNAASEMVRRGSEEAKIPLSHNLEAYLSHALARFFESPIDLDCFTYRLNKAFESSSNVHRFRLIGDECLIGTSLFVERVVRFGSLEHFIGVGVAAYREASLIEQSCSFMLMRDVVSKAAYRLPSSIEDLLELARSKSGLARIELARQNVIVGPWT